MIHERHYFISNDLDDLEHVETELIERGVNAPQIHVLSRDNAGVQRHQKLDGVSSFMKRDLIHSGLIGAAVGAIIALLVLLFTWQAGWALGPAGWTPFVFLALALFGAATWIGGLYGIQQPNYQFRRFQSVLDEGRHVLFVDLDTEGRQALEAVCARHPGLESAGTGSPAPGWSIAFSNGTRTWWYWRMWKGV